MKLRWTKSLPTKAGWYWMRPQVRSCDPMLVAVRVSPSGYGLNQVEFSVIEDGDSCGGWSFIDTDEVGVPLNMGDQSNEAPEFAGPITPPEDNDAC